MERMRDLLRNQLGRSLRTLSPVDRLAAAWPVAVGAATSARTQVAEYEDGRVTIAVPDLAWQRQMEGMANRLKADLARIAATPVTDILFRIGTAKHP